MTLIQLRSSAVFSSSEIHRTLSVTIYCSFHVRVHNLHTRSLSHHWWCSRIQSYVCGTWEIPESPLWDENSELCGTFTHLIWDAIPWLSVTHCLYFKNRMWGTPSKTIFYSFISGIWVKIWLRPNGTAEYGPWGRHESSIVFITPAPRMNFQARCALRALGLLLADGTPTVGGGKTFWRLSRIYLRKQL